MDDVTGSDAMLVHLRAHAKRELRTRMRAVRKVLPISACEERSARANARVLELPEFAAASCVLGYVAMRKELDPSALLRAAAEQGKLVALPRVDGEALTLHEYTPGAELEESGWGVLEPLASAPRIATGRVEIVIVPALALDETGQRLGYGRGFYDRLLPQMPAAFRVGVTYDFQLVPEIPADAHDVPMQCVISDARTLRMGALAPTGL
jgi:5-formyltetrahydrofolate cyclo-ligase